MPKPLLSAESIYDAALAIVDAEGADGLNARALTARLRCSTKTLYQQVGNRDQMIRGTIAHAFAQMKLDLVPGADIGETIHAWATTLRSALLARPALAGLMSHGDRSVIIDYAMLLVEALGRDGLGRDGLGRDGLSRKDAVHAAGVISHVTMSMIVIDAQAPGEWDYPEVFETTIRWLVTGLVTEHPELAAHPEPTD